MNDKEVNELKTQDPFYSFEGMRGNKNIKSGLNSVAISPELYNLYLTEIIKCAEDPIYFANTYFTIVSPDKGKHVIQTYKRQNELIREMVLKDRLVVLASRQVGKCVTGSSNIKLKNKNTNEILELNIKEFFELCLENIKEKIISLDPLVNFQRN